MPRNISFSMTTPQFRAKEKTVTRRLGWGTANPGEILNGVEKAMGLKRGEKINVIHQIRVVSNTREPLNRMMTEPEYGAEELRKEGFPFGCATAEEFVLKLAHKSNMQPEDMVNRIEFEYLP